MEQLVQVFALRSLGYMEETVMPFDHAYDGNDLQATHIIVYDGAEPVGTVRVRWFRRFRQDGTDILSERRTAESRM